MSSKQNQFYPPPASYPPPSHSPRNLAVHITADFLRAKESLERKLGAIIHRLILLFRSLTIYFLWIA
jgi:hypothetical protein